MRQNPMAGLRDLVPMLREKAPTQLISDKGNFKEKDFKEFLKSAKLHDGGAYTVVAIMGPQSSGKSTLLNHLFSTKFQSMNSEGGRIQCTRGVWIAKAPHMKPPTMVLDLEGADGVERGPDDTAFERQIAGFALAVADVLIINMWCHDTGRQKGGSRDLLKDIFEAMLYLFDSHAPTLMFVIRDKTKTPDHILKRDLRKNVEEIWKTVVKPQSHEDTTFSDIFRVEITIMSNYESAPDMFESEVAELRCRLFDSISPTRNEKISFSSAKIIWDSIKGYKDFHLPSHKEIVATVRCDEIAVEKLSLFASGEEWLALQQAAASKLISDFCMRISSILDKYLKEYDDECKRYEKDVSKAKREYLISEVLKVVHPTYRNALERRRLVASREFEARLKAALSEEGSGFADSVKTCKQSCERQFDEQCDSDHKSFSSDVSTVHYYESFSNDISTVRRELLRDIENSWLLVRGDKLPQIEEQIREKVTVTLSKQLSYILTELDDKDIWGSIRDVVKRESDAAALALPPAVAKFELEPSKIDEMIRDLKHTAREFMAKKFKEETQDVTTLLKQRYITALYEMESKSSDEQVDQAQPTTEDAYRKCMKLLSTVAVIRLDETIGVLVEKELHSALLAASPDTLADSDTWTEVPPEMTVLTPDGCRDIWYLFKRDMEQLHADAKFVEDHCEQTNRDRPCTWVIIGLLALGLRSFTKLISICRLDSLLAYSGITNVFQGLGTDIRDPAKLRKKFEELKQQGEKGWKKIMKKVKQALARFWEFIKSLFASRKEATPWLALE